MSIEYCTHCGKEIEADSRYCINCGVQLHAKYLIRTRIFTVLIIVLLIILFVIQKNSPFNHLLGVGLSIINYILSIGLLTFIIANIISFYNIYKFRKMNAIVDLFMSHRRGHDQR